MSLRKRLKVISIIALVLIGGAILVALHHGFTIGEFVVVPGSGDSMQPWSHDGDTLIVRKNQPVVVGNRYVIRDVDLLCKELTADDGTTLHFASLNEDGGGWFVVSRSAVIGKVVFVIPTHHLWENEGNPNRTPRGYHPSTTEEKLKHAETVVTAEQIARADMNKMEKIADKAVIDLRPESNKKYLWGTTSPDELIVRFPKGKVVGLTVQYEGARRGQIVIGDMTIALEPTPRTSPSRTISFTTTPPLNHLRIRTLGDESQHGFFVKQLVVWIKK